MEMFFSKSPCALAAGFGQLVVSDAFQMHQFKNVGNGSDGTDIVIIDITGY